MYTVIVFLINVDTSLGPSKRHGLHGSLFNHFLSRTTKTSTDFFFPLDIIFLTLINLKALRSCKVVLQLQGNKIRNQLTGGNLRNPQVCGT